MLAFTPTVETILAWFDVTHDVVYEAMGVPQYRLIGWPRAGGIGEQEAWLLEGLALVRSVLNDELVRKANANHE
ncbi:MAG: hypothetical protein WBD07_18275 [Vicinamibacterales bacterium]